MNVAHPVTKELQGLQPCTIVGIFRRPAFAVAGLIAGWMQSAARLRFGNAKRASFMGPFLWGLRPNIRCQQRTGDDGPVEPQICHLPTGREGVYYTPSTGNAS